MKVISNENIEVYVYYFRIFLESIYIEDREKIINKFEQVLTVAKLLGYSLFSVIEGEESDYSINIKGKVEIIYTLTHTSFGITNSIVGPVDYYDTSTLRTLDKILELLE